MQGPRVDVHIKESWNNGLLTLTITDNGHGAAANIDGHTPGYGLLGMKERIESAGGSLQAGPQLGGGFEVMATLPYGGKEQVTDETGEQGMHRNSPNRATQLPYPTKRNSPTKQSHLTQSSTYRRESQINHRSRRRKPTNRPVAIIVRMPCNICASPHPICMICSNR